MVENGFLRIFFVHPFQEKILFDKLKFVGNLVQICGFVGKLVGSFFGFTLKFLKGGFLEFHFVDFVDQFCENAIEISLFLKEEVSHVLFFFLKLG